MELMHVTEAIRLVGLSDSVERIDPFYLDRGKAVHHGTHLIDLGRLKPESPQVSEEIRGRLASFVDWKARAQAVFLKREEKVINAAMGYEGTLDWRGFVNAAHFIIDIKASLNCIEDWHRYQTALYALGWCAMNPGKPTPRRAALYLHPDGGLAKFIEHRDRIDLERAKGIMTTAYILKSNGRTNERINVA